MSNMPGREATVAVIGSKRRQFLPSAIIGLVGCVALALDLGSAGFTEHTFNTVQLIEVILKTAAIWFAAWKFAGMRSWGRTLIVLALLVLNALDLFTGHYRAVDAITLLEDIAWIAAVPALARPLK